jgi:hypothetical protein
MATADDASSAWIYLREALVLAVAAFGRSEKRAKKRLLGWLGTEDLPWTCDDEDWRAPVSAEIAQRNRLLAIADSDRSYTLYHKKDPRIFADDGFETDWENSAVREITYELRQGVEVDRIKVPRARLLELLPAESRGREETPEPIKPAERELMAPATGWLGR